MSYHGTPGGYSNHHCRCLRCTAAWTAYCAKRKAQRRSAGLPEGDKRHGTENGYRNWGCRCEACTVAASHVAWRRRVGV